VPSFPTRSKIRPRRTAEGQLSGDELDPHFGPTRPGPAIQIPMASGCFKSLVLSLRFAASTYDPGWRRFVET
jgi:hypothetical protein